MARSRSSAASQSSANLGFEAKLWLAADKLRSNMDAAEYKHVVLGLIFLKYISDTSEEHRAKLLAGKGDYKGSDPEDPDEYKAENVFWVPQEARWSHLQASAKQPSIGKIVDDAMVAIERDNARLKGVLPKDYARPGLDKQRLGELIDLIATIQLTAASEGEKTHRSVDLLGRVYEYFLTRFASAEGKNGGQFYTPSSVVRLLVEMLGPYKGRIYASFQDSPLGPIPQDWEITRLDELASVMMGLSPDGDSYNANGIGTPLINGPVEFGDYFPVKTKWTEAATRFSAEGDLIFCVRGSTTGRCVVSDGEYGIGRGVCAIRAKDDFQSFLYQTINVGLDRLLEKTTGSVFPSLSAPDIKGFAVLRPSSDVLTAFERTTRPLIQRIQQNHRQSRTLANLRDALLPKLLSGELRVAN